MGGVVVGKFKWPRICAMTARVLDMGDAMHRDTAFTANQDIQIEHAFEQLMPGPPITATGRRWAAPLVNLLLLRRPRNNIAPPGKYAKM